MTRTRGVLGGRRDILGLAGGGLAGNASVIYRGGTINVQGNFAAGIFASTDVGSATITTLPETTIVLSPQFTTEIGQVGIDAFANERLHDGHGGVDNPNLRATNS